MGRWEEARAVGQLLEVGDEHRIQSLSASCIKRPSVPNSVDIDARLNNSLNIQISRISVSVRQQEQQIIIFELDCRSSSLRMTSRWSGMPPSTLTSQVPQIPSLHECGMSIPFASKASRIEESAGTLIT